MSVKLFIIDKGVSKLEVTVIATPRPAITFHNSYQNNLLIHDQPQQTIKYKPKPKKNMINSSQSIILFVCKSGLAARNIDQKYFPKGTHTAAKLIYK